MNRDNTVAIGILILAIAIWMAIFMPDIMPVFQKSEIPATAIGVILIGSMIYVTYRGVMG